MKRYEVKHIDGTFVNRYEDYDSAVSNWGWSGSHSITEIDWTELQEQNYLLSFLPFEFRQYASMAAYDRGHSAGDSEITMILKEIVNGLLPAIKAYKLVKNEDIQPTS